MTFTAFSNRSFVDDAAVVPPVAGMSLSRDHKRKKTLLTSCCVGGLSVCIYIYMAAFIRLSIGQHRSLPEAGKQLRMRFEHLTVWVILLATSCGGSNNIDDYQYSKGPIPDNFRVGESYPDRTEDQSCRPIQIHIERGSRRYNDLVTYTKDNVWFPTDNSRKMSLRLHSHLSDLADAYYKQYGVKLAVEKAWTEYPDDEVPDTSLHYEGKRYSIRNKSVHGARM